MSRALTRRDIELTAENENMARGFSKIFGVSMAKTVAFLGMLSRYVWSVVIVPYMNEVLQKGVIDPAEDVATIGFQTSQKLIKDFMRMIKNNPTRVATCAAILKSEGKTGSLINEFRALADKAGKEYANKMDRLSMKLTEDVWDTLVGPIAQKYLPVAITNSTLGLGHSSHLLRGISMDRRQKLVASMVEDMNKSLMKVGRGALVSDDGMNVKVVDIPIQNAHIAPSGLETKATRLACSTFEVTGYPTVEWNKRCIDLAYGAGSTAISSLQKYCPRIAEDAQQIIADNVNDAMIRGVDVINRAVENVEKTHYRAVHDTKLQLGLVGMLCLLFFLFYSIYQVIGKGMFRSTRSGREVARLNFGFKRSRRRSRRRSGKKAGSRKKSSRRTGKKVGSRRKRHSGKKRSRRKRSTRRSRKRSR